jgi:hypothetical protein
MYATEAAGMRQVYRTCSEIRRLAGWERNLADLSNVSYFEVSQGFQDPNRSRRVSCAPYTTPNPSPPNFSRMR